MVEKAYDPVDHRRLFLRRGLPGCAAVYPRPSSGMENNSQPRERGQQPERVDDVSISVLLDSA
jgi:hypothetical protein